MQILACLGAAEQALRLAVVLVLHRMLLKSLTKSRSNLTSLYVCRAKIVQRLLTRQLSGEPALIGKKCSMEDKDAWHEKILDVPDICTIYMLMIWVGYYRHAQLPSLRNGTIFHSSHSHGRRHPDSNCEEWEIEIYSGYIPGILINLIVYVMWSRWGSHL